MSAPDGGRRVPPQKTERRCLCACYRGGMPTALVTGANRGLGLETCRQLLARGYDVLVAARDVQAARDTAEQLGAAARPIALDVTDATSVERAAAEIEAGPKLNALVNNAGVALDGFDIDVVERTLAVNAHGAARVTDALLPQLDSEANVVMVSSGMGELSAAAPALQRTLLEPTLDRKRLFTLLDDFAAAVRANESDLRGWPRSAYRSSKIALNALARIYAKEHPAMRINAVCPGWVRTRMGGASAARGVEKGAKSIVWAATLEAGAPSGGFFRDGQAIDW